MKEKFIHLIENFDFIKNVRYTIIISIAVFLLGLGSFIIKGGFDLGIDFAGGKKTRISIDQSQKTDAEKLRKVLSTVQTSVTITNIGTEAAQEYFLSFQEENNATADIAKTLDAQFGQGKWTLLGEEFVGPKIGKEFQKIAIEASILSLILLLMYIAFRFELKFGVAAVLALFHDVLISLGFISLLDFKFDTNILAAILTLIGFSVNDTIVIFDRIREEGGTIKNADRRAYLMLINKSIIKTMSRSIITTLTVIMATLILIFMGGEDLRPMCIIFLVGLISGSYSTIFIASPILVLWEKIFDKKGKKVKVKEA